MGGSCSRATLLQGPQPAQSPAKQAPEQQQRELIKKDLSVEDCGVSVSWLYSWASSVEERLGPDATTADVCAKVVIPDTVAHKCRYVDLLEVDHVGTPQYFLSHTWSYRFQDLVDSVWHRLQSSPHARVWLDICAINQTKYEDKGELETDDISHLQSVVSKTDSTLLLCLDEECRVFTRIWCLFEIWHTVKAKGAAGLHILVVNKKDIGELFGEVDVRKAQASLESDRVRILAEIEADVGHKQLSLSIKEALVSSADREATEALAKMRQAYAEAALAAEDACANAVIVAEAAGAHEKARAHRAARRKLRRVLLKLLEQQSSQQGPEHPDTLTLMADVAWMLNGQMKYKEAEGLQRQILEQKSRLQGTEHPDTLDIMEILADNLYGQSKMGEAESLQRQLLERKSKVLGPEHPGTLNSMATLASMMDTRRLDEAEGLQRQLLERKSKVLGPEHPGTLNSMADLASTLSALGKLDEAEGLLRQVLEQQSKGPEHPDMISAICVRQELARILFEQGKLLDEAEGLERHAIEQRSRLQGPEHPGTLRSMADLASKLFGVGKLDKAEGLQRQVLELERGKKKPESGRERPGTVDAMDNLAATLRKQGKLAEAEDLEQQVLELRASNDDDDDDDDDNEEEEEEEEEDHDNESGQAS